MATEKADVVIVGVGAAGGILAAELGKAGMKVIGLERGPRLNTKDFDPHDELRYFQRQDLRPEHPAPAGHMAAEQGRAGHPTSSAELWQSSWRRNRPLRRGLLAHARG